MSELQGKNDAKEFAIRGVQIPIIQKVVDLEKDNDIENALDICTPLTTEEIEDSTICLEAATSDMEITS